MHRSTSPQSIALLACLTCVGISNIYAQTTTSTASPETERASTLRQVELRGEVSEVTLYQDAALVSRAIKLDRLPLGMSEVIITNLPATTERTSVYADRAEGLTIRSVAFRSSRPDVQNQVQSQVAQLDASITSLERTIKTKRNQITLKRKRQEMINNLKLFTPTRAEGEFKRGILKADELNQLLEAMMGQYEVASNEILQLDFEIQDHRVALKQLEAERKNLAAPPTMRYDAVILLEREEEASAKLRLNYLVKDCGWSPVYNVRGTSAHSADKQGQDEVSESEIEFNALIHQVSGEDWSLVKLKLSTASPKTSAYNPLLTPLHVQVSATSEAVIQQQSFSPYSQQNEMYSNAIVNRQRAISGQLRSHSFKDMLNANFDANTFAADLQVFELSEQMGAMQSAQEEAQQSDLNIQYTLIDRITLPSRREGQTINVFRHKVPTAYYRVATPVLTASVFREAELLNSTDQDLLSGQVNVYLNGRFIGRTSISTIPRGQKFNVGFGVDGQLRVHRALIDRDESVQGGNRQVKLSVEIAIDHYSKDPLRLMVRDRVPHLEDQSRLRVKIDKLSHPLSEDPNYKRFTRPKNILLWDFEVAPGHGEEATVIQYDYIIEFDKNQMIRGIRNEEKSQLRGKFLMESQQPRSKKRSRRSLKRRRRRK